MNELGTGEWPVPRSRRFALGKEAPLPIEKEADWAPELVWTFFLKIRLNERTVARKHQISTLSVLIRFFCYSHRLAEEFAATFRKNMLHSSTE